MGENTTLNIEKKYKEILKSKGITYKQCFLAGYHKIIDEEQKGLKAELEEYKLKVSKLASRINELAGKNIKLETKLEELGVKVNDFKEE
jgi:hypothetical protein